jgi:hypothetical protein
LTWFELPKACPSAFGISDGLTCRKASWQLTASVLSPRMRTMKSLKSLVAPS